MAGVTYDDAVNANTIVTPAIRPGTLNGNVTRQNTRQPGAPRVRAASSSAGWMRAIAEDSGNTSIGRNTCSEPMMTAVSEYNTRTGAGPKPIACNAQLTTPVPLLAS